MLDGDPPVEVLRIAVVAPVLREEHAQIGPLVTVHARLYEQMRRDSLDELPRLARRRYRKSGLRLLRVPRLIDAEGDLA